ncbi:LCP family protein [Gemella sp. GL1.1]|nr:LCP family protein [Gemella sp. GL1.1]MBF0746134.1 LCP family protein [Gemella sp. 19428wG2_WT2a]NYS27399.1 LCP family protein [Gemella sp. GL1]TFU60613.1 LytR family transcriptional regulator [Gemella sp. WT2a]
MHNKLSRTERYLEEKKKVKRKKRFAIFTLAVLLAFIAYVIYIVYHNINNGYKKSSSTVEIDPNFNSFSVLVMGIDENESRKAQGQTRDNSRTDSLVYLAVNKEKKKMDMVSIPRDSLSLMKTEFDNRENSYFFDKINHAYAYSGVDGTIESVSSLLNAPINFYIVINFAAFEKVVDSLGGVNLYVPFDMKEQNANGEQGTIELKEGWHTLSGAQALAFSRSRYYDSDLDRGQRQLQVIHAVIDKAKSLGALAKIDELIQITGSNVTHDLSVGNIATIASMFTANEINIVAHKIGGYDAYMDGVYYYYPKPKHLLYLSSVLNDTLGLPLPKSDDLLNIVYQDYIRPLERKYTLSIPTDIENTHTRFFYINLDDEDQKKNLPKQLKLEDLAYDPTISNENRPT